jgi:mycofactocin precursor
VARGAVKDVTVGINRAEETAMDPSATTDDRTIVDVAQHEETEAQAPLVEEDLLIEDVSIDGMCGVY